MLVKDAVFTNPSQPIQLAAKQMVDQKVGGLPVLEIKGVMGLVTSQELLARLSEMMIADVHAVRATMAMPLVKGEMTKLVNAISTADQELIDIREM